MSDCLPIVGVTMGDPVGIGPEIILLSLCDPSIYDVCRPLVLGDVQTLYAAKKCVQSRLKLESVDNPDAGRYSCGQVDVLNLSDLDPGKASWGKPTVQTGRSMVRYITAAVDLAVQGQIAAMTTCPINKAALQLAGFAYTGHTDLLAERTKSDTVVMMFAGERLRVALVTIHVPLARVPSILTPQKILKTIQIVGQSLAERFGLETPRIAVAGLNPHAGEGGMFGNEEKTIIEPAIREANKHGFDVVGPFPPDTIFYHASQGHYDVVVSLYHDQGLIAFKLLHFHDGVNTTLGLPIIRTSVDHGTAYDIAGSGTANPGSLLAAIKMAAKQAAFSTARRLNQGH